MKISAILSMHGNASKFLIESSEIILGKQKNISYINFNIGDSLDKLINSYTEELSKLDTDDGVILMVDIWGGSPFNAACQVLEKSKYKYSIVSGVNLPMLIDFFMIRDKFNLVEVTKSILSSAKIGINNLSNFN